MQDFFFRQDALEAVSRQELVARLKGGMVTVLDVRSEAEFSASRVSGAVNVPIPELELRLDELPNDRVIIAYCRGPYCVMSFEAAAALRAKGYEVRRLKDDFPEWKAAGLEVETA